jgi:hypothetical protein
MFSPVRSDARFPSDAIDLARSRAEIDRMVATPTLLELAIPKH